MRVWRTSDGGFLVEGRVGTARLDPFLIQTEAGEPIADPHDYYRFDASGVLQEHYDERTSAYEEEIYGTTYQVVDDELRSYHTSVAYVPWRTLPDGTYERRDKEQVRLTGLAPVDAADVLGPDPAAGLKLAYDDYLRRAWAVRDQLNEPFRLACEAFSAALDDYQVDGPVELTFVYRAGLEVHDAAGTVVFRYEKPPQRGKDLHSMMERLLKQRYGDRVDRLHVDLSEAPDWYWAYDE